MISCELANLACKMDTAVGKQDLGLADEGGAGKHRLRNGEAQCFGALFLRQSPNSRGGSPRTLSKKCGEIARVLRDRTRQTATTSECRSQCQVLEPAAQLNPRVPVKAARPTIRSPFPGNGILRGRDSGVEKARHIQPIVGRDKIPARKLTNSALFCRTPENLCLYGTAWWG